MNFSQVHSAICVTPRAGGGRKAERLRKLDPKENEGKTRLKNRDEQRRQSEARKQRKVEERDGETTKKSWVEKGTLTRWRARTERGEGRGGSGWRKNGRMKEIVGTRGTDLPQYPLSSTPEEDIERLVFYARRSYIFFLERGNRAGRMRDKETSGEGGGREFARDASALCIDTRLVFIPPTSII